MTMATSVAPRIPGTQQVDIIRTRYLVKVSYLIYTYLVQQEHTKKRVLFADVNWTLLSNRSTMLTWRCLQPRTATAVDS